MYLNNNFTIEDIKSSLNEVDDLDFGTPKSDDDINIAEKKLSVILPSSFKEYLKCWGNLSLGPIEYYGLTKDSNLESAGIPNFVWFTLQKREQIGLPDNLVVFQNLNDEVYCCLDTSSYDKNNECPVVKWDNINSCIDMSTDSGFFAFLLDEIEEYIDTFE